MSIETSARDLIHEIHQLQKLCSRRECLKAHLPDRLIKLICDYDDRPVSNIHNAFIESRKTLEQYLKDPNTKVNDLAHETHSLINEMGLQYFQIMEKDENDETLKLIFQNMQLMGKLHRLFKTIGEKNHVKYNHSLAARRNTVNSSLHPNTQTRGVYA